MRLDFGTYVLVKVYNVPLRGDYPGAIQLYNSGEDVPKERYTLIPGERMTVQLGRYESFLGGKGEVFDPEQYGGEAHILEQLFARLIAGQEN